MFEKNDRVFYICRKIVRIAMIVLISICFVAGLVLLIAGAESAYSSSLNPAGLGLMIGAPIALALSWFVCELVFSYMLDVKYIRNKLYGVKNNELPAKERVSKAAPQSEEPAEKSDIEKLRDLKALLDDGILSEEEYAEEKTKILDK